MKIKSKIVIFKGYWTENDVKKNLDALFVYGDNDAKIGKGGQAIIRDLPNTIGIPTKKYPTNHSSSFYTDKEYYDNIFKIDQAINQLIDVSQKYRLIVLPEDGFGTGLAQLPKKAPLTYKYLVEQINNLQKII
ncbi:hypothetical protein QJ850_gp528 [Acanthamoeba polyphaga mimivirus]|uniref:DUF7831 domain-containing protein n=1 Tax=Acanthamoeba polyphaga mimivirus Kroon TaxID=3069720 RepID=A0A0G2YAQ1_9VIRU|nr:hypothetical protein QJ850_gp528 [Acanthamoeba polyphaga mimivirus]AKI80171.1 hypothetical protein [Acanthamoeba polyphaga mimivirus Kroon]